MPFDDNIRESVGHPTDAELKTYWTRRLNPDETYAIGQHLASCEDCRTRAQQLPDVEASVNWLQADQRLEAGAGHLSYEIAVEIAGGTPPPDEVRSHLETCPSCRADVDDLRSFRDELARVPEARQVTPRRTRPTAFYQRREWQIAAALLLAVALGVYIWKARQPTEAALKIQLNDDGGTVAIDDKGRLLTPHPYPREYAAAVSRAVETGTVDIPAEYAGASRREQLLGPSDSRAALELDSPVGVAVESITPTFRWQALPNAASYRVAVYGRGYREAMTSGDLTAKEWTPGEPLARDASYTWTVTAKVAGKSVLAPVPPAPEARFRVISSSEADALTQARHDLPNAHLVLGLLYARMGLTPESRREMQALQKANPNSDLAKTLLAQIQGQKPSPINTKPAQ